MRRIFSTGICALCLVATTSALHAADGLSRNTNPLPEPEALLIKSLEGIANNRLDEALDDINRLLVNNPNFRLAHLIKGDLLLSRSRPIHDVGDAVGAFGVAPTRVAELRDEARARLQHAQSATHQHKVPKYLLQMSPAQKYAVIADTQKSRVYVYQNVGGSARYVADYYISSGKKGSQKLAEGDQKTPVGVYFVTANLPREKLSDFYGSGAFPISYPNEWDKRVGNGGSGIWLHGTPPDTYSRAPRASNGCVVLANHDLNALAGNMQVGLTPVIIADEMEWVQPEETVPLRDELLQHLDAWRRDWESKNSDAYLAHYAESFASGAQDLSKWAQHKRGVNAAKTFIKVSLDNVSLFLYPGKNNLAVIDFEQDYQSSNLANKMKKRQYWQKENGRWKIIYEGGA